MLRKIDKNSGVSHSVSFKNLKHPILIRSDFQDIGTIINNIIREEYGHFTVTKDPCWMIDAGAYIGDTSVYFLSRFPNLNVIALEPNLESYKTAKKNLKPYGKCVKLLQKGLFSNDETQYFSGAGTGTTITKSGTQMECISIMSLIEQYSIPRIDFLKMDIEGAEENIFSSNPELWLQYVDMLIIEIHGHHIKSLITEVLGKNNFSMVQYRSLWYCKRTDI